MKYNDFWGSKTDKITHRHIVYSNDGTEILEWNEDVEPFHSIGKKINRHLKEGTRKSRETRRPKAVDDIIAELLLNNPEASAAELFRSFPKSWAAVEDNMPYKDGEYVYYPSATRSSSGRFRKMGWEGFRKRVRKVKIAKKI